LERVRQAAGRNREERFTALLHHVDLDLLRAAYGWLKRAAAPGVDGVTWRDYKRDLEANLEDLHARLHRGAYRAQPTRRQYIAKADGGQRPLGIAALEDKIVQRAVVEVLNAIYEEDFLGFSYGWSLSSGRPKAGPGGPGRGPHDALDALTVGIKQRAVSWILDADIAGFFDTLSHEWLVRFLEHRVGDRRVLRLVQKWLKAGVLEDGRVTVGEEGTPQGAVISPLLANLYLHYVFDLWAEQWRRRHARGAMIMVRYADDIVVGFQHEAEARQFQEELKMRLAVFALKLNEAKTRLIEFGRQAAANRRARGQGKPETFDFLGFTHICERTRGGAFQVRRRTQRKRMRAKLKEVKETLWRRLHEPIGKQGAWLRQVVLGYYGYHAVPNNIRALSAFRRQVRWLWWRSLRQRSQKDRTTRAAMVRRAKRWLPEPHIRHPWPEQRFAVTHPRWEPGARMGHAGFCAGGVG
jgi:group II intron reverse transcriptase/maturase